MRLLGILKSLAGTSGVAQTSSPGATEKNSCPSCLAGDDTINELNAEHEVESDEEWMARVERDCYCAAVSHPPCGVCEGGRLTDNMTAIERYRQARKEYRFEFVHIRAGGTSLQVKIVDTYGSTIEMNVPAKVFIEQLGAKD